jgi:hypothetical protein
MSKIVGPHSAPAEPDPEEFDEFEVLESNGDCTTYRLWYKPKTNTQRHETEAALRALKKPSLESATHSNKERAHDNRKTRQRGNRLRGAAQCGSEARRKDS